MRAEWANERVIQMSVIQNADNKVLWSTASVCIYSVHFTSPSLIYIQEGAFETIIQASARPAGALKKLFA